VEEADDQNDFVDLDRKKWSRLGIETIEYPIKGYDHSALVAALEAWDMRVRMGRTDHRVMIAEIVMGGPVLTPVDHDYLVSSLSTEEGAREFVSQVESVEPDLQVEWLRWVEDLPYFRAIFSEARYDSLSAILGYWFCWSFIAKPELHGAALQTVQRLGQKFDPSFIDAACRAANLLNKEDVVAGKRWKTFLASLISAHGVPSSASALLPYEPGEQPETEVVLRAALAPNLLLKRRISFGETEDPMLPPDADVHWDADFKKLKRHVLKSVGAKAPGDWALRNLLETALHSAYDLLEAYHGPRNWDSLSFGRMAVEPHEQDQFRKSIDAVIDGLRAYGEKALTSCSTLPEVWWSTDRALFRRLALHLVRSDQGLTADEKISWIIDRSVLYENELKHEVYLVLGSALGKASEKIRSSLLAEARVGPTITDEIPDHKRRKAYAVFNLVGWLHRAAPNWEDAEEALADLRSTNPEFEERDHPDMNRWMTGGSWGGKLPMEVDDFITEFEKDPLETVRELLNQDYSKRNLERPEWSDCLSLVSQIAESYPDTGRDFWSIIDEHSELSQSLGDLQISIVEGWAKAPRDKIRDEMLERVASLTSNQKAARAVSRFLFEQIQQRIDDDESALLGKMRRLASDLYDKQGVTYRHSEDAVKNSFATLELNSWPGDVARYWMAEVDRRWRKQRDEWDGFSVEECTALTQLVEGPEPVCDAAGPALTSNLYFIFAADPDFAVQHVLPLFQDERYRAAAWRAYLYNARVNDKLLAEGFLESLVAAWDYLDEIEISLHGQFFSLVVSIISFASITTEQRAKLLDQSVLARGGIFASEFVQSIGILLEADKVDRSEVWKQWLHAHMSSRLRGIPRDASNEELSSWGYLIPYLGAGVPEAISLYMDSMVGFDSRYSGWDFPDGVISSYGSELVDHYADRIRCTDTTLPEISHNLSELVDVLRAQLSTDAIQPIIDAMESKGL